MIVCTCKLLRAKWKRERAGSHHGASCVLHTTEQTLTCAFGGCSKIARTKGYCYGHTSQQFWKNNLTVLRPHATWSGDKRVEEVCARLTESQLNGIKHFSKVEHKSQAQIVREAIDEYLEKRGHGQI